MKLNALKVAQVNNYISRIISSDPLLNNIRVIGEISNLKYHGSGYIFFTLKDENSRLNCYVSQENSRYIKYIMDNGMEVTAAGYINVFEKSGSYTLNVTDIDVKGQGNLHIAFEKLKEKLRAKGYFDIQKKQPIHPFPKKVAIITAETGAAIRDMIKVIHEKNSFVEVFLFPSLVQGEFAAQDIASNIDLINKKYTEIDTIIIGRGGGSLEELWAFNEEVLADSIYNSLIPIISAVGHETDYSIADFVADVRAATPTKAAEMAVPDLHLLGQKLTSYLKDMKIFINRNLTNAENSLYKRGIEDIRAALFDKLEKADRKNEDLLEILRIKSGEIIKENSNKLAIIDNDLENLNPEVLFKRGYSITLDQNQKIIKSIKEIDEGDNIFIMLTDGTVQATVTHKAKESRGKLFYCEEDEDE